MTFFFLRLGIRCSLRDHLFRRSTIGNHCNRHGLRDRHRVFGGVLSCLLLCSLFSTLGNLLLLFANRAFSLTKAVQVAVNTLEL